MRQTKEQHRRRHQILHRALDELAADWALHHTKLRETGQIKLYTNSTIMELMQWSHKQTVEPDELGDGWLS